MTTDAPIRYFLEVKDLREKGYEVVVSVVNEGEDWLYVKDTQVDIQKDGRSFGRYPVFFPKGDKSGMVKLGQFEVAEGHFHIKQDVTHDMIRFHVLIDYRYGDHHRTQTISQRVETKRITHKQ